MPGSGLPRLPKKGTELPLELVRGKAAVAGKCLRSLAGGPWRGSWQAWVSRACQGAASRAQELPAPVKSAVADDGREHLQRADVLTPHHPPPGRKGRRTGRRRSRRREAGEGGKEGETQGGGGEGASGAHSVHSSERASGSHLTVARPGQRPRQHGRRWSNTAEGGGAAARPNAAR